MSASRNSRVLMAVYNEIEFDGRVQRAAEALSSRFDVTVLSPAGGSFSHPRYENVRVALPQGRRNIPVRHLMFLERVCREAIRRRPAAVYAHDFFLPATGRLAASLARAKFIYDAHELIVPTELAPTLTSRERFFYELERRNVRAAHLIVAANEPRARIMREHYGLPATPLVIRNLSPAPQSVSTRDEVVAAYPQLVRRGADVVRVVYQGDMSAARGVGELIEALAFLSKRFEVVLVGTGPDLHTFLETAERRGVRERVISLGRLNRDRLADVVADCEVGFLTYVANDANNYYCAPNKVFEYAHVGLPVIAVGSPYLRSVVEDAGIGIGLAPPAAKGEALAAAILRLSDGRDAYLNAVKTFAAENQWEADAARLREAVEGVVSA